MAIDINFTSFELTEWKDYLTVPTSRNTASGNMDFAHQPIRVPTQDFKKEKKKKGPLVALPIIHFAANHGSNPGFQNRKKKGPPHGLADTLSSLESVEV
jgi:hypothetical protein